MTALRKNKFRLVTMIMPLLVLACQSDTNVTLITMHHNGKDQNILSELMIDRFVSPQQEWHQPIMAMQKKCK